MGQARNVRLAILICALGVIGLGCSPQTGVGLDGATDWVLTNPQVIDLRLPQDFFKGKLQAFPDQTTCHTQGIEIVGDALFISCCLYNDRQKILRSFVAESYLLKAEFNDLNRPNLPVTWRSRRMTESLPESEEVRVSAAVMQQLPESLVMFLEWIFPLDDIKSVLGHPSGMIYDEASRVLWVANAVYSQGSYSRVHALDPDTLEELPGRPPISVPEHLGFLATLEDQRLWSIPWSEEPSLLMIDPATGKISHKKPLFSNGMGYQDCARFDAKTLFCGGTSNSPSSWYPHRTGLLHALDSFRKVRVIGNLRWRATEEDIPSPNFGYRSFISLELLGDMELEKNNRYGSYETPLPLTNAGLAISADKKQVYFLPDDLPGGKLIRFDLVDLTNRKEGFR